MRTLEALPAAECVSGNLLPVGIAHLAAQELPDELSEALQRSFSGALADYMESSTYRSRSAALRKWWIASRGLTTLRPAAQGVRTESTLVYKEPFLAFAPDFAYQALPNARLLYLYRDGRDVADSLVRSYDVLSDRKLLGLATNEVMLGRSIDDHFVPWWVAVGEETAFLGASQYARAAWMWREMVRRSQKFVERTDVTQSGRVLAVRYEELMSDSLAQGQAIVEHLGEPMPSRMRAQLEAAHANSIGIHSRRDATEIAEAEMLAGPELQAFGYRLHIAGEQPEVGARP
jgi:Sulfotransferase family